MWFSHHMMFNCQWLMIVALPGTSPSAQPSSEMTFSVRSATAASPQSPYTLASSSPEPAVSTVSPATRFSTSLQSTPLPTSGLTSSTLTNRAVTTDLETQLATSTGTPGISMVHSSFSLYCNTHEMTTPLVNLPNNIGVIVDDDNGSCFLCFDHDQRYLQTTFSVYGGQKRFGILMIGHNMKCGNPDMIVYIDSAPGDGTLAIKHQCLWKTTNQPTDSGSLCEFWCDGNVTMGPVHVSVVLELLPWKSNNLLPIQWCETMLISMR